MTTAVRYYVNANPGVYGYDVIKGNNYAKLFWIKVFEDIGAMPVALDRVRDKELEKKLDVYGYETFAGQKVINDNGIIHRSK